MHGHGWRARRLTEPVSVGCSQGGVQAGLIVELSNGGMAVVVSCDDTQVALDANSMLAGKALRFELELVGLERA